MNLKSKINFLLFFSPFFSTSFFQKALKSASQDYQRWNFYFNFFSEVQKEKKNRRSIIHRNGNSRHDKNIWKRRSGEYRENRVERQISRKRIWKLILSAKIGPRGSRKRRKRKEKKKTKTDVDGCTKLKMNFYFIFGYSLIQKEDSLV